jgi:hypothetical protein
MSAVRQFIRIPLAVSVTLSTAWCAVATAWCGVSAAWCGVAAAFENGPPPAHTGALGQPNCTVCHFDNDANIQGGAVKLSGVPATYLAGQQYAISVTLEHSELSTGGFQLAIQDIAGKPAGRLDAIQDDVKTLNVDGTSNSYIQHSKPRKKRDDDTDIQWTVVWTAPGGNRELIIGVAAVAANDDASALGDYVYTTTARVNSPGADSKNEDRR